MKTKFVIGVDPGMSGAIAVLLPQEKRAWLISLSWSGQIGTTPLSNSVRLWNIFRQLEVDLSDTSFVCEHVHTFTSDGIKSAAKFMSATSAAINALEVMRAAQYNAGSTSGIWRYQQPAWFTLLPQVWRTQIRSLVGEEGKAPETTKNGSLRWFERLSSQWEIFTVVSHSNERVTPVIDVVSIHADYGMRKRTSADQREAFLIAIASMYTTQKEKNNG